MVESNDTLGDDSRNTHYSVWMAKVSAFGRVKCKVHLFGKNVKGNLNSALAQDIATDVFLLSFLKFWIHMGLQSIVLKKEMTLFEVDGIKRTVLGCCIHLIDHSDWFRLIAFVKNCIKFVKTSGSSFPLKMSKENLKWKESLFGIMTGQG